MFLRSLSAALVGCALLAAPVASQTATRGPSTPEERKQALEYIRHFEADPLNPKVIQEREWVLRWVIEVPDVHIHLCADLLDKLPKGKKDSSTILIAEMFSQTAFQLQNPDKQDDRLAEHQAGVEGALHVYEILLKSNPKDRQPFLDDLILRRDAGTLAQWVKEHDSASCMK
jgi:hypothetical protein